MAFHVTRISKQGAPTNGASEVVELSITGIATDGTFTLTFGSEETDAIEFDAAASAVESAFTALSSVGAGNAVCTGGPLPTTPVVITFSGSLAGLNVGDVTSTDTLTGTDPATALSVTTTGAPGTYRGVVTGAVLIDETNGNLYVNTGTPAVPTWTAWSDVET